MFRAAMAIAVLAASGPVVARADETVRYDYAVTLGGLTIGGARLTLEGEAGRYAARLDGDWSFLFWSGAAALEAEGRAGPALSPSAYRSRVEGPKRLVLAEIAFGPGAPRAELRAEPPLEVDEEAEPREPLLPEHLPGSVDPLSAFLIPASSGEEACAGVRRVFSGAVRFDVALHPVAAGAAPGAAACAGDYRPVSGHRIESRSIDRLRKAGLEIGFFEIAPGLWAPDRIAGPTGFGELALVRRREPAR